MGKNNQRKMEREFQRALAIEFVKSYCSKEELSIEKLSNEEFYFSCNECVFAHPSDVVPNGLLNDIETQPKATLVIKHENGILFIEQTEHTKEFLSNIEETEL